MQHEFSFAKFFVYLLRKWFIVLAAAIVGLAAGLLYSLTYEITTISVYEGTIRFSVYDYYRLVNNSDLPPAGESSFYGAKASDAVSIMGDPAVMSRTYDIMRDKLYPDIPDARLKNSKFFNDLVVTQSGYALRVSFAYNIGDEGKSSQDRALAIETVETYLHLARETLCEQFPELSTPIVEDTENADGQVTDPATDPDSDATVAAKVLTVTPVTEVYNSTAARELSKSNTRPSPVKFSLIGVVAGIVVGAIAIVLVYLLDPRIKSMGYAIPDGMAGTVYAGELGSDDSLAALRSTVYAANKKKLLLTSDVADKNVATLGEKFVEYLNKGGHEARLTVLDAGAEGGKDWRSLFGAPGKEEDSDVFEVYAFAGGNPGAIGYISGRVGATVLVVDQKGSRGKRLLSTANTAIEAGAEYLGAVVYDVTDSWLD